MSDCDDDLAEAKDALMRALRNAYDNRPARWVRRLETILGKLEELQNSAA